MRKHIDVFGEITLTLNKLIEECGYSTKSHNASHTDFRRILKEEVIDRGFADTNDDITTISHTAPFTMKLVDHPNIFYTQDQFVQISIAEYEAITGYTGSQINKSILIGVYLFIKQYISPCTGTLSYPSKNQIQSGIGISSHTTIERAISALEELKLIYILGDMYVESKCASGIYVPTRNVYSINKEALYEDAACIELEKIYGKSVYRKNDVPGRIGFIQN